MSKTFDLLGLGAAAVDHLLYVPEYPAADTKATALRSTQQCGGLAATALVAAARLGARCAYAGVLGNDDASAFVAQAMTAEGIDLSHVIRLPNGGPVHSTIIVGAAPPTRNIFTVFPEITGAHPALPSQALIESACVLHIDHLGVEGMLRAARIARAAGVAIVSDLEKATAPNFDGLLALVDHVVMSEGFAIELTAGADAEAAARALWTPGRRAVVVTCGERGCVFTTDGVSVHRQAAPRVKVVDTTGCGDVFHGIYGAMLARGESIDTCVRIATLGAALKATKPGAQSGAPTWAEISAAH